MRMTDAVELYVCAALRRLQVAVLDTGIDKDYKSHPAFRGINVTARNFTTPDVSSLEWLSRLLMRHICECMLCATKCFWQQMLVASRPVCCCSLTDLRSDVAYTLFDRLCCQRVLCDKSCLQATQLVLSRTASYAAALLRSQLPYGTGM
jgi:hypothetical protein